MFNSNQFKTKQKVKGQIQPSQQKIASYSGQRYGFERKDLKKGDLIRFFNMTNDNE